MTLLVVAGGGMAWEMSGRSYERQSAAFAFLAGWPHTPVLHQGN